MCFHIKLIIIYCVMPCFRSLAFLSFHRTSSSFIIFFSALDQTDKRNTPPVFKVQRQWRTVSHIEIMFREGLAN